MSVHLFLCLNVWNRLPLVWFLFILILETLKCMAKNPNFVKTGGEKKYWGLLSYDLSRFSCCQHNKITTEVLLTATCKTRMHKNALLCFYGTLSFNTDYTAGSNICRNILLLHLHCNVFNSDMQHAGNDTKRTHCCWRSYHPTGRLYRYNHKWTKIFYTIL